MIEKYRLPNGREIVLSNISDIEPAADLLTYTIYMNSGREHVIDREIAEDMNQHFITYGE